MFSLKEAPMTKFLAVLMSIAVVVTSFASAAEAGPGRHFGMFFGGMAAAGMLAHAAEERRREEAYERARAREMMVARERERRRAIALAAAKRERARQYALQQQLEQQKAAQAAATEKTVAASDADKPALKKGDRLPSAGDASASTPDASKTTTVEKTSGDKIETSSITSTDTATGSETCRRYSAATDSVIEMPCQ
jgi:hypothetical protein